MGESGKVKHDFIISSLLLFAFGGTLTAHEIPTHQNITRVAVQFLQQENTRFACTTALNDLLQIGTVKEDDPYDFLTFFPLGRFFFHFLDKLDNEGNQSTCSSSQ